MDIAIILAVREKEIESQRALDLSHRESFVSFFEFESLRKRERESESFRSFDGE